MLLLLLSFCFAILYIRFSSSPFLLISQNPEKRPTAEQMVATLTSLKISFILATARIVRADTPKVPYPAEDDVDKWFTILLKYDRQTFDNLLKDALTKNH
jgi:hypothetical protein